MYIHEISFYQACPLPKLKIFPIKCHRLVPKTRKNVNRGSKFGFGDGVGIVAVVVRLVKTVALEPLVRVVVMVRLARVVIMVRLEPRVLVVLAPLDHKEIPVRVARMVQPVRVV